MAVELTIADSVAEIALNDPGKLNALDAAAIAELSAALSEARRAAWARRRSPPISAAVK